MKWSPLAEKVHQLLKSNALLKENDRILLAVSGGMDSVAMMSVLAELKEQWHWELIIGHIDHGLRPNQDESESRLCANLAQSYGLQYLEKKISLKTPSENNRKTQPHSLESLAREKRYEILEYWADEMACNAICTAHHESDQAETILYRMLTGSGIRGLRGIPEKRGRIKRPFLHVGKDEIESHVKDHHLTYADDPSNQDQRFTRNLIRHQVIPGLIKAGFPAAEKRLSDSAGSLDEAFAALDHYAHIEIERTVHSVPEGIELDQDLFLGLPAFIQKQILGHVISEDLKVASHMSDRQLEQLISFVRTSEPGSRINIGGRDLVNNRYKFLWPVSNDQIINTSFSCEPGTIKLPNGFSLDVRIVKCPPELKTANPFIAFFSMSLQKKDLLIRSWKPGDLLTVFGAGEKKKVSDVLKDEKVKPLAKSHYPVLELNDHILWIPGIKRSDLLKVEKHDEILIMMTYKCGDGL